MEPYVFLFSSVRQMVPSDKASDIALALCAGQSPLHVPRPLFLLVKICVVFSFFLLNKSNLPPNWNNWLDGYVIDTKKLLAFRGAQMINFLSQMRERLLKNWLVVYPYWKNIVEWLRRKRISFANTQTNCFFTASYHSKMFAWKSMITKSCEFSWGFLRWIKDSESLTRNYP